MRDGTEVILGVEGGSVPQGRMGRNRLLLLCADLPGLRGGGQRLPEASEPRRHNAAQCSCLPRELPSPFLPSPPGEAGRQPLSPMRGALRPETPPGPLATVNPGVSSTQGCFRQRRGCAAGPVPGKRPHHRRSEGPGSPSCSAACGPCRIPRKGSRCAEETKGDTSGSHSVPTGKAPW